MLTINESRLHSDLDALAQLGRTPDSGVTRIAMSEVDLQGRAWFRLSVG
jgi:N-carbamoyl-L-amino-acid hydrolase